MFVADGGHRADFSHATERMGSNVGAAWLVAEVFGEKFFAPVRRREARLDCYLRNWRVPSVILLAIGGIWHKVISYILTKVMSFWWRRKEGLFFTRREPFLNGG